MGEFIDSLEKSDRFGHLSLFREIVLKSRDLEFLFEQLDEWIGKEYYAPYDSAQTSRLIGMGLDAIDPETRVFRNRFQQLIAEAITLRRDLKREVFHAYRDISKPDAVKSVYGPVFDLVADRNKSAFSPLTVFTTNYDPCVEIFCEQSAGRCSLHDGFFHDGGAMTYVWRRSEFDTFNPSESLLDVVLFKLHGSTNWTKTNRGITKSAAIFVEDDSAHENVLIYPANRKVAIDEPFFTGYDYFQKCMENCSLCIVIGYSFRDYDALTKLMSAARSNESLKLLILDPKASQICGLLKRRDISAQAVNLSFGNRSGGSDYVTSIISALNSET